jgi:hypothetical protein
MSLSRRLKSRLRIVVYSAFLAALVAASWSAVTDLRQSDFFIFWEAARRLSAHADPFTVVATSVSATHSPYPLPYAFLPEVAWLMTPLGRLSFRTANEIWLGISLASIGVALGVLIGISRRQSPRPREATLLVCAATITAASVTGIAIGQADGPLLLLAVLALRLLPGHRLTAGVLLGVAAAIKPQILWLVPLALLVTCEWRTLAGMGVGAVAAVGLGFLVVPASQMGEWLRQLVQGLPTPPSSVALPGITYDWGGPTAALVAAICLAPIALAGLWWVRARLDARTALSLGIVLSLAAAPHDYSHDLLLLGVVAAACWSISGWSRSLALAIIALDAATYVDSWLPASWDHLEAVVLAALAIALIWQARPHAELSRGSARDPQAATTGLDRGGEIRVRDLTIPDHAR